MDSEKAELTAEASYTNLQVRTNNFLKMVCGEDSSHYYASTHIGESDKNLYNRIQHLAGVLAAAHHDFEDGFLFNIRNFVRVEVLTDFLTQADALFTEGVFEAAASLTGAVLEDALRRMCDANDIVYDASKSSIAKLNAALYEKKIYNAATQDFVNGWGKVRNQASHGKFVDVKSKQVEEMIMGVRSFVSTQLSDITLKVKAEE